MKTKFRDPETQKKYEEAIRELARLVLADAKAMFEEIKQEAIKDGEEPPGQNDLREQVGMTMEFWEVEADVCNTALRMLLPNACPGCGCVEGEGYGKDCAHPEGCGYFKGLEQVHDRR